MLNRLKRSVALAIGIAMLSSQACYSYLPVEGSANPRANDRVRVMLTSEGTTELARYLGPSVTVAEGDLSSIGADGTMVVAVDFVQQANGIRQPWSGEGMVSIPAAYRTAVHRRTYLRKQSIVAGAALTAALVATAIIAIKAGGAQGDPGGGGTQPPP